jgi:hypothetical protein
MSTMIEDDRGVNEPVGQAPGMGQQQPNYGEQEID